MFLPHRSHFWRLLRSLLYLGFGLFLFIIPGITLVGDLSDPALRSGSIPRAAWRLNQSLAPRYAKWAADRVASRKASQMDMENVADTEWPLFGSVFYLWSLESLQHAWEIDHGQASVAPAISARSTIEACANLVTDPNHATWVRQKWGDNYLHRQDLFYRFLLISAMTSYTRLTDNPRFLGQLRDQVDTLSAEFDSSPHGWLEDYPGECYPTDIVGALAAIRRADSVLKTDHSALINRALRGFQPPQVDRHGLPPYFASATTGVPMTDSRGCGNSFALICAPEIWPSVAHLWYQAYDTYFWQRRMGLVGFREFSNDTPDMDTFADVDSGPVILGYGFAASAFGTGAARVNGRMDQAGSLTAEMLVSSWPLGDGTLLVPHLLSKGTDAPYLGEVGILFCLTCQPIAGIQQNCSSVMTPFVSLMLLLYFGLGTFFALPFVQALRASWQRAPA